MILKSSRNVVLPLLGAVAAALMPVAARAQCPSEWLPGGEFPGVTSSTLQGGARIQAMISWDPDGAGPQPPVRVIAGSFDRALGVSANNIAVWDGTTFSPLGSGIGPDNPEGANPTTIVYALAAMPNGDLIAGGKFTTAGGAPASNIARWDPVTSTWSALGAGVVAANSGADPIRALAAMPNGDVIAGGQFITAGGMPAARIAKWDGTAWSTLGSGMTGGSDNDSYVLALQVMPNGNLIAGGDFTLAGGIAAGRIASWDPSTGVWSPLGVGIINQVFYYVGALALMPNGDLIVGGRFFAAGDVLGTKHIARWDGSAWNPLGSGLEGGLGCDGIAVMPNGDVIAVGGFDTAGVPDTVRVARWNPVTDTWSALGSGLNFTPKAAAVFDGELYVGGDFHQPFKTTPGMGRIGRWDGTAWKPITSDTNAQVWVITKASNGDLLVGGAFTSIEGVAANRIARWNGSTWSPLGTGIDADPALLSSLVLSIAEMPNGDIVAGGNFVSAGGGVPGTRRIARWNGTTWSALGTGMDDRVDADPSVSALAVLPNGDLIAGGAFTAASGVANTNRIARWDGTAWTPVGTGMDHNVDALKLLANGDLLAGGAFTSASGVPNTSGVARWDGTTWNPLGAGTAGSSVETLAVLSNGDIIAGGAFTSAGGDGNIRRIARWNGSAWSALGAFPSSAVYGVAELPNGDIVATGPFSTIGGISASRIARWDGTAWWPMGTGLDFYARAFFVEADGTLLVGGAFQQAGPMLSAYLAQWGCPQSVCCVGDTCSVVTSASACVGGTFNPHASFCSPPPLEFAVVASPVGSILDTTGNGNGNGTVEPGESDVHITIPVLNQRRGFGCDFTQGTPTVTGVAATLTSLTPTATVVSGISTYPDMPLLAIAGNTTPFVISVSPSHPCGTPVSLRLTLTASGGSGNPELDVSIPVGSPGATVPFPRTSIAGAIPDNNPAGVNVAFTVAGMAGSVGDIKFQFDGSSTTSAASSTATGLGHANLGDLVIKLTSPQGTTVTIVNRPGGGGSPGAAPSTANNFYQMTLEDSAIGSIQQIGSPTGPITGSYLPANPLSAFTGENPNGVWTLNVADVVASTGGVNGGQGGTVRHARLIVISPAVCEDPAGSGNDFCCRGTTCNTVASGTCTGQVAGSNSLVVGSCGAGNTTATCCFADFNHDGSPSIDDLFLYLNAYFTGSPWANVGGDGVAAPTIDDLFLYINAYFTGCA